MCLGVPGKLIELWTDDAAGVRMGRIDFGGVRREVCMDLVDAELGDYVLVHVGFALSRLDESEAHETLALLKAMGALEEEMGEAIEDQSSI